jgi:uncharacterized membrane protein
MSDHHNILIMAGYPSADAAQSNFDQLVQLVKTKQIETEGMILAEQDQAGRVSVRETGDRLGRKGMGWGAGVGLLVGLLSPPLLGSIVVGAAREGCWVGLSAIRWRVALRAAWEKS